MWILLTQKVRRIFASARLLVAKEYAGLQNCKTASSSLQQEQLGACARVQQRCQLHIAHIAPLIFLIHFRFEQTFLKFLTFLRIVHFSMHTTQVPNRQVCIVIASRICSCLTQTTLVQLLPAEEVGIRLQACTKIKLFFTKSIICKNNNVQLFFANKYVRIFVQE